MPVLKNVKHEKWLQGMASGLEGGLAWTAAGYAAKGSAAQVASSRQLKRSPKCRARLGELQGGRGLRRGAKKIADVRDLARECTEEAVEVLKEVMMDKKAMVTARVSAAKVLLDRGHGQAVQHIEAEISVYDSLDLPQKQALLEVIDRIIDADDGGNEDDPDGPTPTHH